MGGFQHVYLSGQCGQIILLALPAHCPPHCTALPSVTIAHSQVTCEFASFVAEFISPTHPPIMALRPYGPASELQSIVPSHGTRGYLGHMVIHGTFLALF